MILSEALELDKHKVISLVGAGGKTTTMFTLAHELVSAGKTVITTTTTRIAVPSPVQSPCQIIESVPNLLLERIRRNIYAYRHITIASEKIDGDKLKGISTDLVAKLARLEEIAHIVVEADGSAQKPLKAPNSIEPVMPDTSSLVIIIIGWDAIGKELTDDNVFRAELAARLLNVPIGYKVDPEMVATLVTHPHGLAKGIPGNAKIVCLINKVAADKERYQAKKLADLILAGREHRIEKVLLGNLQSTYPVVECITKSRETAVEAF